MLLKRLLTATQHAEFSQRYAAQAELSVDVDFLARSEVWGFYRRGVLVAGFVINRNPPFRYLSFPEFDAHFFADLSHRHTLGQLVEIVCIWHDRSENLSTGQKAALYAGMLLKACSVQLLLTKTVILGGSFNQKVGKRQKTILSTVLFQGYLLINGKPQFVELYYAYIWQVAMRIVPGFTLFFMQEGLKTLKKRFQGKRLPG